MKWDSVNIGDNVCAQVGHSISAVSVDSLTTMERCTKCGLTVDEIRKGKLEMENKNAPNRS